MVSNNDLFTTSDIVLLLDLAGIVCYRQHSCFNLILYKPCRRIIATLTYRPLIAIAREKYLDPYQLLMCLVISLV